MKKTTPGRKPISKWEVKELRKLRKQGFSLRECEQISDLAIGTVFKYTK